MTDKKTGRVVRGALSWQLKAHPDSGRGPLDWLEVEVAIGEDSTCCWRFRGAGDIGHVRIPRSSSPLRGSDLWKHTCFEVFLTGQKRGYDEFNFSPSSQWSAYRFSSYREGMTELDPPSAPRIEFAHSPDAFTLAASVDLRGIIEPNAQSRPRMALAAVIEADSGQIFYWALSHPPGKPDFHRADGFVGVLPDNVD